MGRTRRPTDIGAALLAPPMEGMEMEEELAGAETDTEQFRDRVATLDADTLVDFALRIGALGLTADEFDSELSAVEGEEAPAVGAAEEMPIEEM